MKHLDELLRENFEVVSVLLTLMGAYFAVVKDLYAYRNRDKLRSRADSEFALKMADQTGDERFKQQAVQLGMAGLLGGPNESDSQRRVLQALGDPFYWDRRYQPCARYVQIDTKGDAPFSWRDMYATPGKRFWSLVGYWALVAWLVLLSSLSIVMLSEASPSVNVIAGWSLVTLLLLIAFYAMKQINRMGEAKLLVAEAAADFRPSAPTTDAMLSAPH